MNGQKKKFVSTLHGHDIFFLHFQVLVHLNDVGVSQFLHFGLADLHFVFGYAISFQFPDLFVRVLADVADGYLACFGFGLRFFYQVAAAVFGKRVAEWKIVQQHFVMFEKPINKSL